jgi:type IV secretion system protein VirB10
MLRIARPIFFALLSAALIAPLFAIDPERDFSGKWFLDARRSNTQSLPTPPEQTLTVVQQDIAVRCSSTAPDRAAVQWSYLLDGTETRSRIGDETRTSVAKWEGAALLINTQVLASQDYTVMDRWKLSGDRSLLTITRQVVRRSGEVEGELVYSREVQLPVTEAPTEPSERTADPTRAPSPAPVLLAPIQPSEPALMKQPGPDAGELTVRLGTHIALSLRNGLDTRHTHEGDRVYLETIQPVAVDGRIVIPRGSYVNGTVTESKPAHGVKGKGEMYIRFDSLLLPNGVSRDFHSRLASADSSARGQVDSQEGKVTGERDGSGDARTVATGGGIGAGVGAIAGSAAGHALGGVGIGAGVGAGVGLATILHDKRPEAVLPRGTIVEMILDRDLRFSPNELW